MSTRSAVNSQVSSLSGLPFSPSRRHLPAGSGEAISASFA
jgi:hypothetical protein